MYFNIAGNSKWVHAMEWSGQKDFGAAATVPFKVDGAETGQIKSHGPLTFLKVSFCLFLEYVCLSVHAMLSNFEIFSAFFKTNFEIFFAFFKTSRFMMLVIWFPWISLKLRYKCSRAGCKGNLP